MGLITKTRLEYTADTGRTYEVDSMTSSHLMNAINHHQRQVDCLERVIKDYTGDLGFIKARKADIEDAIDVLCMELCERNPDEE